MPELNIDTQQILHITPKDLTGVRIAVLGIPGSGKSNTIAVLLEEHLPYNTGVSILDMHDEYWGLKQKFPFLRVGKNQPFRQGAERKSPPVDLELNAAKAADFAEYAFMKRIPTIVNLRWMSKDERQEFVLNYLQRLYELNMSYGRPYWVVLEEAHTFIPEGRKTPELEKLTEFAAEGRKLGFTLILGSQRSAKIDKDVLSSCDLFFLHRVSIELDVRSYRGLLPAAVNQNRDLFITMRPGQAVVKWLQGGLPQYDIVQIRQQATYHVGATPDAAEAPLPELQTVDMHLLDELDGRTAPKQPPVVKESKALLPDSGKLAAALRTNRLQTLTIALLASRPAPRRSVFTPVAEPISVPHDTRQPLITSGGLSKQERAFNGLLRDVINGCKYPFHITILKYLIEREDLAMTVPEIARFVGLSESTVYDHPPLYLCTSLVLLCRTKSSGVFRYRSCARETLAERFPDLPTDALMQKLIEALT